MFSPFRFVACVPNGEAFDSTVQSGFGGENRASIEDHHWHFVTREIHQGLLSQSNSFIPRTLIQVPWPTTPLDAEINSISISTAMIN